MRIQRDTTWGPDAAPGRGTDRGTEAADRFAEVGGEANVDEVLAGFDESTPEEIIALADGDGERTEVDAPSGDEPSFDGFVLDATPTSVERDSDGESVDVLDGLSAEELFGGR